MHEDAGRLRRRRMLLLFRHQRKAEGPALASAEEVLSADEDYLNACGTDARYTVIVEDLARRVLRQQPIDGPVFQIGQGPQNDLWLKHERIQPRHLLLVRLPEGIYFIVLSPDAEVHSPKGALKSGWWTQGQVLRIGAFRLRLAGAKKQIAAGDPLAVSPHLERDLPHLELRFLGAATPRKAWPVTRTLTLIGRSPVCKIRLDHEEILPVEAVLVRTAGRLWLINLSESDRVLVNDAPILSASLEVGDRASFGEFQVELHATEEWPTSLPATTIIPATPAAAPPPSRLDELVQECAAQHQKILAVQQQALENLEMLAAQAADPAQVKSLLEQIRKTNEVLGSEQARLQEKLRQAKPANRKPGAHDPE